MNTSKIITINKDGITVNWKYLLIGAIVLFGGGGSWFGLALATKDQVDDKLSIHAERQKNCDEKQDQKIKENKEEIKEIRIISGEVKAKLDSVQEVQHKTIARDEARRLTETIRDRPTRERNYDRLYDLNMKKLKKGDDPCSVLDCN